MANLRIKAIVPADPDELFSVSRFFKETRKARVETEKDVRKDLEKSVQTWTKKPKFIVITSETQTENIIQVTTTNKVYLWLDEGTGIYGPKKKPIVIVPKKKKVLRFWPNYKAKTSSHPNAIIAKAGGANRSGKPIFAQRVVQKGIRPRNFFKKIQRRNEKKFQARMDRAVELSSKRKKG